MYRFYSIRQTSFNESNMKQFSANWFTWYIEFIRSVRIKSFCELQRNDRKNAHKITTPARNIR